MPGNKQLGIEAKHVDMIKYGINAINNMPKKERVLADMLLRLSLALIQSGHTCRGALTARQSYCR